MKPSYEDPGRNIQVFSAIFEDEGLDWAVIGGIAAIERRAESRETVDVDFVVSGIADLNRRLQEMHLARFRVVNEPDGAPFLIQGETTDGMHFDIYVASIDFEEAVLATKDENHVASAEAIVLYKLMAMRPQDVDDIRSILAAHPDLEGLDLEFIEYWANELDVRDQWHGFVAEARRIDPLNRQLERPAPKSRWAPGSPTPGYVRKQGVDSLGRPYTRWVRIRS